MSRRSPRCEVEPGPCGCEDAARITLGMFGRVVIFDALMLVRPRFLVVPTCFLAIDWLLSIDPSSIVAQSASHVSADSAGLGLSATVRDIIGIRLPRKHCVRPS